MDDDDDSIPIISREMLVKQGTSAVTYLAGGILLMIMTFGARLPLLGIVLSAAALVIGAGALFSKNREDKKPGLIITIAGALGMITRFGVPVMKPFAAFILGVGAIGLFLTGIIKGIQFLRGLKSRR